MKIAILFPGQGSQSVGMMSELMNYPIVKDTFLHASDILKQDFLAMATEPNELLNQTINTQPLMLTAGVATWKLLNQEIKIKPLIMAGHSLGEYSALVAAGALSFEDALPLVKYRAEVMQSAVAEGEGAMAAILGLDDSAVRGICIEAAEGQVVEAVNLNSPGQIVIAGHKDAVDRAIEISKAKGAKRALLLPVSVPSHCSLMRPAAEKLSDYLSHVEINAPCVKVLQNASVMSFEKPDDIKLGLVKQLYSPVRWIETIQYIHNQKVSLGIECGPGKVLAGMSKRIIEGFNCIPFVNDESLNEIKRSII